jgi:acetylglutamate kinase
MNETPGLINIGGAELENGPILDTLVNALVPLLQTKPMVIVHGGGTDIARLQERLGLEACFVDGLRVTDNACMDVAEMVLSGSVNKRLTARLVQRGVRAIGLSGVDGGLLRAKKLAHPKGDLGRVGEIISVDAACLLDLIAQGFTPIVSPISLGDDGSPFNVNADHAALAIASALKTPEMIFLTNVPGVLDNGTLLPELSAQQALQMIEMGTIFGGMIPKVHSALAAISVGVGAACITDLAGLAARTGTWVFGQPAYSSH